jgi:hydroxyacylglutathione hydrolase
MNLEDHLGDIIRKARSMNNVPASAAARAGGLTEAQLSRLEESGTCSQRPDFTALARAIGLESPKLEGIAKGWLPAKKDLDRWRRLRVFTSAGDDMTVNAYLIWDEATRDAAVFDTGFDAKPILATLAGEKLELAHILITHSHHDHVVELGTLRGKFPKAAIHSNSKNAPADQRLRPGETIEVGGLRVSYRETPGHAADGVTYLISNWPGNAPQVAIVGDAIFAGSMGRGNDGWELARQKVREHILALPPDTLLGPGHGPMTTVAEERAHNPFF